MSTEKLTQKEINYLANAGQTMIPFLNNNKVPRKAWTPTPRPNPPTPPYKLRPGFEDWEVLIVFDHELHGVSPEMLDWFWSNMEKCYFLWAPGDHKWFEWIDPPGKVGFVGSRHRIVESMTDRGPVLDLGEILRVDMCEYPFTESLKHVIIEQSEPLESKFYNIHMWEARDFGCLHREIFVCKGTPPMSKESFNEHDHQEYEAAVWCDFLPKVYELWKANKDPSQNVFYDLSVKKLPDGGWAYVNDNSSKK